MRALIFIGLEAVLGLVLVFALPAVTAAALSAGLFFSITVLTLIAAFRLRRQ